jgi:hypothetical protein
MNYESTRTVESAECEGVTFRIARISFARRLELARRVRELGRRIEFEQAGDALQDKLDAAVSSGEVDRLYLECGLLEVAGLTIDGEAADAARVIERGPELLCREMVREVRRECGLTEEERKN